MLKSLEMFAIAHSDYILIFFIIHACWSPLLFPVLEMFIQILCLFSQ